MSQWTIRYGEFVVRGPAGVPAGIHGTITLYNERGIAQHWFDGRAFDPQTNEYLPFGFQLLGHQTRVAYGNGRAPLSSDGEKIIGVIAATDAPKVLAALQQARHEINLQALPYQAVTGSVGNEPINSNSVLRTLFEVIGMEMPSPINGSLLGHTGSGNTLLSSSRMVSIQEESGVVDVLIGGPVSVPRCFLAGVSVQTNQGLYEKIESLRPGDQLLSYAGGLDARAPDAIDAPLVPKRVMAVHTNITRDLIEVRYMHPVDGEPVTVHMTPGHVMLTASGQWVEARRALMAGECFVTAEGEAVEVAWRLLRFESEEGRQLTAQGGAFAQASQLVTHDEHGLALAPRWETGWRTYNLTVEDHHTYVAGGLRVHNASMLDVIETFIAQNDGYFPYAQPGSLAYESLLSGATSWRNGTTEYAYVSDNTGRTIFFEKEVGSSPSEARVVKIVVQLGDSGREAVIEGGMTVNELTSSISPMQTTSIWSENVEFAGATIGQVLGSQLGKLIGNGNIAVELTTSTLLGTLLSNVGQGLQHGFGVDLTAVDPANSGFSAFDQGIASSLGV